jgi:very-short-patch-repair endonuclease
MGRGEPLDAWIGRTAARQAGAINLHQVRRVGGTKRAVDVRLGGGRLIRPCRATFVVNGAPETYVRDVWVTLLGCPGPAYASCGTVARLRGLDGFAAAPVEVVVPRGRRARAVPGLVHETRDLPPTDVTTFRGIPVTTVERMLLDLSGRVPIDVLEDVLDDALRKRLVSWARLRKRLADRKRVPGSGALRKLVAARGPRVDLRGSKLEKRLGEILERAGLPKPVTQYRVYRKGKVVARPDFAYPELRIAIEFDGAGVHMGRKAWEHGAIRDNYLELERWTILGFTSRDTDDDPDYISSTVREARDAARLDTPA